MQKTIKHYLLTTILLTFNQFAFSQTYTISGFVKDTASGESLIGANVYDQISGKGVTTNAYGFYSLSIQAGDSIRLLVSYVGYKKYKKKIKLTDHLQLIINLKKGKEIKEVIISAQKSVAGRLGVIVPEIESLKQLPTIFGEADIFKSLKFYPGVQMGSEGSSHLFVRGGKNDQNLILLDDVPVYFTNHLGGMVSVFNPSVIKNIKLYKGAFPANYGGRLSSVVDIRTKEGNMKKIRGDFDLGILSLNTFIEGPIIKDKLSFMFSGRVSPLGCMLKLITLFAVEEVAVLTTFYDINAKINYKISGKNNIYLSFYSGYDINSWKTKEDSDNYYKDKTEWGNLIGSVRWNHVYSEKLFSNLTATYSKYGLKRNTINYSGITDTITNKYNTSKVDNSYKSGITDYNLSIDFDYFHTSAHLIKFGAKAIVHNFIPALLDVKITNNEQMVLDTGKASGVDYATEASVYILDKFKINEKLNINVGIYTSMFAQNNYLGYSIEPRILLSYDATNRLKLEIGYSEMKQYLQRLSYSQTNSAADIWIHTNEQITPAYSRQSDMGFSYNSHNNKYIFSLQLYYKYMTGLAELKEGVVLYDHLDNLDYAVESNGEGNAYGAELWVKKNSGKLQGWLSYAYARSLLQFENINLGEVYPSTFDRPHELNIVTQYYIKPTTIFSAVFSYASGHNMTMPYGQVNGFGGINTIYGNYNGQELPYYQSDIVFLYSQRNDFRLPAFHSLDISFSFIKEKKKGTRTWKLGIYNVYNHKNANYIYFDNQSSNKITGMQLKKVTLFPMLPMISYSFSFK